MGSGKRYFCIWVLRFNLGGVESRSPSYAGPPVGLHERHPGTLTCQTNGTALKSLRDIRSSIDTSILAAFSISPITSIYLTDLRALTMVALVMNLTRTIPRSKFDQAGIDGNSADDAHDASFTSDAKSGTAQCNWGKLGSLAVDINLQLVGVGEEVARNSKCRGLVTVVAACVMVLGRAVSRLARECGWPQVYAITLTS